jgi:hypothetical protein
VNEKLRKKAEWAANQSSRLRSQLRSLTHQQLVALAVQRDVLSYQEALDQTQECLRATLFETHTKPIEPVKA